MATKSSEQAKFVGLFQGCTGLRTAGYWLARRLHQLKASTTMDLGISNFFISVRMCGLEKLGLLVDQNWLEHNSSVFLLKTLVVGRRQQSESIEIALDME